MKVIQCDRCHCIYTPKENVGNCATVTIATKFTKDSYDLCVECTNKFYTDFIKVEI